MKCRYCGNELKIAPPFALCDTCHRGWYLQELNGISETSFYISPGFDTGPGPARSGGGGQLQGPQRNADAGRHPRACNLLAR